MGSNDNAYVVLTNFLKKMAKIGNGYLRVIVLSSNFGGKIHVNVVVLQKFDVDILGKDFAPMPMRPLCLELGKPYK